METPVDNEDIYFTSIGVRSNSIQVPTELVRIVSNGTGPVTVAFIQAVIEKHDTNEATCVFWEFITARYCSL